MEHFKFLDRDVLMTRGALRFGLSEFLDLPSRYRHQFGNWSKKEARYLGDGEPVPSADVLGRLEQVLREAKSDSTVIQSHLRTQTEGDRLTSIVLMHVGGGYERVELDHGFFRQKQRETAVSIRLKSADEPAAFEAAPAYWNNFVGLVDLFLSHEVHLIVNEMVEAPFTYLTAERKAKFDRFMRERVQPYVEGRGVPYVRIEWDRFTNEDYFDYNHLNRRGIRKLAPLLAEALRPHIRRPR